MSYSELRQLPQLLTQLNFPIAVSTDSFLTPNFKLTAQILQFLLNLTLPDVSPQLTINTPDDRVYFITTAVQLVLQRLHLKLSAKKLYAADSNAAHELLKFAKLLSEYLYIQPEFEQQQIQAFSDLTGIAADLRIVSADLVEKSTNLMVALRETGDQSTLVAQCLQKQPDVLQLQSAVQDRITALEEESRRMDEDLTTSRREKITLQESLTQKTGDNSRMQERLESIRTAKPPFIQELEAVEQELTRVHEEYARKHRSLQFLESQLTLKDQKEAKKRVLQNESRKTVQDIIKKQEKEDILSNQDPFLITPGPLQAQKMQITNQAIPEGEEQSYYAEEEEAVYESETEPIDSQVNLSDVLDNDTKKESTAEQSTTKALGSDADADGFGAADNDGSIVQAADSLEIGTDGAETAADNGEDNNDGDNEQPEEDGYEYVEEEEVVFEEEET